MRPRIPIDGAMRAWIVACLVLLLPAKVGADGTQTGLVAGVVTDADDRAVPGVQIRLDGADGQRSAVSDSTGRYRFPSLRPGLYRLRASLLSLSAAADDIAVYIGRTTPVDLRLVEAETLDDGVPSEVLPGPSESVQVVALAPLVDPLDTRVRSVVRREFLDVLPVERFYQSVALLLPDVAGGGDGNPNVGGALRSNNLFLVDGVDTTDPVTGLFGLNLAYEAVESVEVSTAGLPAEHGRVSGSVINVVTRSSGDEHRGSAYWLLEPTKGDIRSRPGPENLAAEIAAANAGNDDDQTVSATLGGPLSSDGGAWYFLGGNESDSTVMQPTLFGELWDGGVSIDAGVARLGWRLADSQTIELQYTLDSASSLAFSPLLINAENTVSKPPTSAFSALTVPTPGNLAAVSLLEQSGSFAKLDWGAVLGPAWTLNARISTQDRELERSPATQVGITGNATHADITSLEEGSLDIFDEVAFWNGISDVGRELRPRRQLNLAAGWFGGSGQVDHDLRVGIDFQDTESETDLRASGTPGFDRETGQPVAGQFFFDLGLDDECINGGPCSSFDPVAGTFGPFLFLNMPVRPAVISESTQSAIYLSDAITTGRWLIDVGLRWERQEATSAGTVLAEHDGIAPRLGVKYDARGDGSTLYSLYVGRYFEPLIQGFLDTFLRPDFFSGATLYFWDDFFADLDPACADPSRLESPCWVFDGEFTPGRLQEAALDPGLRRTHMDELVLGFERRLSPTLGLQMHWVQRRWEDLWDDVIFADVRGDIVRNIDEAERRHRALRLLVQKRFADGWQLLASITRSRTEGNLFTRQGDATFFDFRDLSDANQVNRYGPAPYDRPTQVRLFGLYELPLRRTRLTFGTAFAYESGTPWQATREDFDLGAVVFLDPRGSRRLDDLMQWDLSLTAAIETSNDLELLCKVEVFNVFDEQTQIGVETDIDRPGFGLPRGLVDIQAPRRWRFSIELRF